MRTTNKKKSKMPADRIQYLDQMKLNKLKTSLPSEALVNTIVEINGAGRIFGI